MTELMDSLQAQRQALVTSMATFWLHHPPVLLVMAPADDPMFMNTVERVEQPPHPLMLEAREMLARLNLQIQQEAERPLREAVLTINSGQPHRGRPERWATRPDGMNWEA